MLTRAWVSLLLSLFGAGRAANRKPFLRIGRLLALACVRCLATVPFSDHAS